MRFFFSNWKIPLTWGSFADRHSCTLSTVRTRFPAAFPHLRKSAYPPCYYYYYCYYLSPPTPPFCLVYNLLCFSALPLALTLLSRLMTRIHLSMKGSPDKVYCPLAGGVELFAPKVLTRPLAHVHACGRLEQR